MQTLSQLHDDSLPFEEEEKRHGRRLVVGILCALLLTGAILGGYLALRKRHERQLALASEATRTKALAPRVEVFVDEPTIDGKKSLLGGTLHNISGEAPRNLSVQLELRQRKGGGREAQRLTADQAELAPDAQGRYHV